MNPHIKPLLVAEEGLKLRAYKCSAGKTTVGVGRNLDDRGITVDEAMYLLDNDVREVEKRAQQFDWYGGLDDVRRAVVLSMLFQLGVEAFKQFHMTIEAIAKGDYETAAERMLQSLWAKQTPNRAARAAQMMRTGKL